MSKFIKSVNSITIRIDYHNTDYPIIVKTNAVIPTSGVFEGDNQLVCSGDSGSFTCPVCNKTFNYKIIGDSEVKVKENSFLCKENSNYEIDHNASLVSTNETLSSIICGQ